MQKLARVTLSATLIALTTAAQAATVQTTDFIASPTYFNGFDTIGDANSHAPVHSEGGITVRQINGDGADIWTTYTTYNGGSGYGWYPNGGDNGYTSISLTNGNDFQDVSFLVGSGFGDNGNLGLYYELHLNGAVVQSGSLNHQTTLHWLGFSGGGFDEVLLADSNFRPVTGFGVYNAAAIDSIKATAVPEAGSVAMALGGLAIVATVARRRRAR
ncbi:MAG TPA: PEP-CTERM sorting domain-containing protein [Aquabacterium sp.]|uniref:PEP-CTERM sorting domain-containing protein n=1 Tax=Aquabacterium sp. TaxID=1872578 RepID=UPI002E33B2F7|nr:PEP-CTERM sorting domain-containing protein [Aquabacterium sp.]HEX5355942.1 PEP-CTERM sorting domain-containing protein [Aquabacterium sp.]